MATVQYDAGKCNARGVTQDNIRKDGWIAKELHFTRVSQTVPIWPRKWSYFYKRSKTEFARWDHARGAASCSSWISLNWTTSLAQEAELSLNSTEDEFPERTGHQTLFLRPGDLTLITVTTADGSKNNEIR